MIMTFVGANLQAMLWQSSSWLVSTVLPAVVVQLTNDERSDLSEAPLSRSATLDAAAKMKAQHMAKNGYFAHFAPDGTSPWHWFDEAGYVYAHAGENLAIHFTDSGEVVDAWMNSPKHRENIVNGVYTEIGVGTAKGKFDGYDTVYVVQLFGTPAQAPVVAARPVTPAPTPAPAALAVAPVPAPAPVIVPVVIAESDEPAAEVLAQTDPVVVTPPVVVEAPVVAPAPAPTPVSAPVVVQAAAASPAPVELAPAPISNPENQDVFVYESLQISTSSGLAVASVSELLSDGGGAGIAGIVTKPNTVLQILYTILAIVVLAMLMASVALESKREHYIQVAYGFLLMFGMAGLWFVHAVLTTGATIA
jgi:hypothetical protein